MKQTKRETTKKVILLYISGVVLALSLLTVVSGIANIYEESYRNSYEYAVQDVKERLERGHIDSAQSNLEHDDYYGENFEYAWEQILIYHMYDRYRIMDLGLKGAVARGADKEHVNKLMLTESEYKLNLEQILEESTHEENENYVAYYQMLLDRE